MHKTWLKQYFGFLLPFIGSKHNESTIDIVEFHFKSTFSKLFNFLL